MQCCVDMKSYPGAFRKCTFPLIALQSVGYPDSSSNCLFSSAEFSAAPALIAEFPISPAHRNAKNHSGNCSRISCKLIPICDKRVRTAAGSAAPR